jgi:hypothetical protein
VRCLGWLAVREASPRTVPRAAAVAKEAAVEPVAALGLVAVAHREGPGEARTPACPSPARKKALNAAPFPMGVARRSIVEAARRRRPAVRITDAPVRPSRVHRREPIVERCPTVVETRSTAGNARRRRPAAEVERPTFVVKAPALPRRVKMKGRSVEPSPTDVMGHSIAEAARHRRRAAAVGRTIFVDVRLPRAAR